VTTANGAALQLAARHTVLRQAFVPGWAALACILVAAHAPVGIRAPVVIVFLCVVPGTALVGLLNPDAFAVKLSLSIALSVALSGLTAGVLVYVHLWSPTAVIVIVAAISFAGGLRDVGRGHRRRGAAAISPDGRLAARAANGAVAMAAAKPDTDARHAPASRAHSSRPERAAVPPVAASPQLGPHELADLLSWSSLQGFVREVNPELWFVDDLETPRGVWIRGVLARTSIPFAWRVLEDDGEPQEWRTRLAFEMIDALPELGGAVVAAGTAYGSLSGFRRGLEARCLPYLLRVDPATAAGSLAPDRPCHSASEAREILREWLDGAAAAPAGAQANGAPEEPALVVVQGAEHLLVCEVPVTERASGFWLSNLPTEVAPKRLASLVRLANRTRVERATPDRRTLDPSAAPAKGAAET
jgi:hypothetical protein